MAKNTVTEKDVKHTVGPWFVRLGPPNGVAVHWSEGGQICAMRWTDGLRPDVEAAVLADAYLIAAAPDMKRVLTACYHALESYAHSNGSEQLAKECAAAAMAVLRKAEGRS